MSPVEVDREYWMLWHDKGGAGAHTILLLHGLGATAGVWKGVRRVGEHDAMESLAELRMHCQDAQEIVGAGHNSHVEKPAEIVALLERLLQR
jgi:pimeloyl-ACP methyl ester carboxylesterase